MINTMYHIAPTQKIKSFLTFVANREYMTWLTDWRQVSRQDTQSGSLKAILWKEVGHQLAKKIFCSLKTLVRSLLSNVLLPNL